MPTNLCELAGISHMVRLITEPELRELPEAIFSRYQRLAAAQPLQADRYGDKLIPEVTPRDNG